jgi:hypothetical protein
MKRLLLLLGVVVLICSIYILISSKLTISKAVIANCNLSAADRCFSNISRWVEWWPGTPSSGLTHDTSFTYNGCTYRITGLFYNDVHLSIQCADNSTINSNILIAPLEGDSILIVWNDSIPGSYNLLKKILLFRYAGEIQKNMDVILGSFKSFIENTKNIYGVNFHKDMSKDSILVTMNSITTTYPTTPQIYLLIDSLKKYIAAQGAKEINYPMLNVSKKGNNQFNVMVAISVNKRLAGNNRIMLKQFVPWKMLEGEVRGGVYSVEKAFEQMQIYKIDYNISIQALPFQSLITDRSKEQDSTKWITKICAPIS